MTPVEELREAAALMRKRAEAATPSPWRDSAVDGNRYAALVSDIMPTGRKPGGGWDVTEGYGGYLIAESVQAQDREHIASWHPAVALAVADWLDAHAGILALRLEIVDTKTLPLGPHDHAALALARAYLAREP